MSELSFSLPELGWSHFFQQQLSLDEWESTTPARVLAVHRNAIEVASEQTSQSMMKLLGYQSEREEPVKL